MEIKLGEEEGHMQRITYEQRQKDQAKLDAKDKLVDAENNTKKVGYSKKRERQTERDRERERDKQREREGDRQRKRESKREREREGKRDKETEKKQTDNYKCVSASRGLHVNDTDICINHHIERVLNKYTLQVRFLLSFGPTHSSSHISCRIGVHESER